MSSRTRELLERARAADKLGGAASQRISQGVLEKLARGESPLIDVSPVVLPKLSLWNVLWHGSGFKSLLVLSAGVVSLASFTAVRMHTHEASVAPVARATPVVELRSEPEPSAVLAPAPAAAPTQEPPAQARATKSSSRAGPVVNHSKHEPHHNESARAKPKAARTQPFNEPAPSVSHEQAAASVASTESTPTATKSVAPKAAAPSSHLDAELGLLRRAYKELHAGKPADAQATLDEHAQRFPHGALEEPREVARMNVLCKLGRERAARVRADNFLLLHPKSPFAERVRNVCSDNKD